MTGLREMRYEAVAFFIDSRLLVGCGFGLMGDMVCFSFLKTAGWGRSFFFSHGDAKGTEEEHTVQNRRLLSEDVAWSGDHATTSHNRGRPCLWHGAESVRAHRRVFENGNADSTVVGWLSTH